MADNNLEKALKLLEESKIKKRAELINFKDSLGILQENPGQVLRSIFQSIYHAVMYYLGEGEDEYPDDPESIGYKKYNADRLFVEGMKDPFFADRLFVHKLVTQIKAIKQGGQQNKIYIFEGKPGSGKSTFLNNLLEKITEYRNSGKGIQHEVVWRLNLKEIKEECGCEEGCSIDDIVPRDKYVKVYSKGGFIEVPCPSHDHPILMIPIEMRRKIFDKLLPDGEFKEKLFSKKEFEWVFTEKPCTICESMFNTLLDKVKDISKVFELIFAKPFKFDRRLSRGISVYNPGDKPDKNDIISNDPISNALADLFMDSTAVAYFSSRFARINNGVYALMDIKDHNKGRFLELHNVLSEGIFRIGHIEEGVNSFFVAVTNPEDKPAIEMGDSFKDRIVYIQIPYILDINTEVKLYLSAFGDDIKKKTLPRILENFARIIIATRIPKESEAMKKWINKPDKYAKYCDDNLILLKQAILSGEIPRWLSEEDVKKFKAPVRKSIIEEAGREGDRGVSGRDSQAKVNEFLAKFKEKPANMKDLINFFEEKQKNIVEMLPPKFLEDVRRQYNYLILGEVRDSLFHYSERQIRKEILNYLTAINYEIGEEAFCPDTKEKFQVTEELLKHTENYILKKVPESTRKIYRDEIQKKYSSETVAREIEIEGIPVTETKLFKKLFEDYTYVLKEGALKPFLGNENFRSAIKDFGTERFKTYEKVIRDDVEFLLKNLQKKYGYTEEGAKEICLYVIDEDLAKD